MQCFDQSSENLLTFVVLAVSIIHKYAVWRLLQHATTDLSSFVLYMTSAVSIKII